MKYTERSVKKNKQKRAVKPIFWASILMLLVAVLLILTTFIWFKVERVEIYGESIYTRENINLVSKVEVGDSLVLTNAEKIEETLIKELPYIKEAKVTKVFPSVLRIEITSNSDYGYLVEDNKFILFDENLKVLNIVDSYGGDAMPVKLKLTEKATIGVPLVIDKTEEAVIETINSYSDVYGLNLTMLNTTDIFDIRLVVDNRFYVYLGNTTNVNNKLEHLKTVINDIGAMSTGTINFNYWSPDNAEAIYVKEDIRKYIENQ